MEPKSTVSIGSIVGLCAIVLVLWFCFNAMGNNAKFQTGLNYLQTGQEQLDYRKLARQDAIDNGISADLFERQINEESAFSPAAISPAGAIGIAQIMPDTAAGWGIDARNPVASLSAAASAMARYYTTYQSYAKALACYNAGSATLNTAIARYGANWEVGLPQETQNYIRIIDPTGV